ncbi:ribosome biogenesis/translation initiation ATPase RLI [Candidatus Woesearchaeota archaeon]|nr:ribosome biogenesis/translation initiation ATPase RLI [Candidatus Woesearchaeota archaeon]
MVKRIAVIDKEKCNPIACGDFLCIRMCPLNRAGKEAIVKGPDGKAQINEDIATDACQVCVNICPFGAIHMVKLPEQLTQRPVHRFGKDSFVLYNLPLPSFGTVLGIIGRNGIGKSTALKILAGALQPNLGDVGVEHTMDDLMKMYKGTEMQKFLEKIKDGEIKLAYKPQAVDVILRQAQGKVKDLLKKVDQRGKLNEVIEALDIQQIQDREMSQLSGGEQQRVAIAATVLKDANLYFFDEPASFLDITSRIKVAKLIRSLADANHAVVVIEHDLATLDYISDQLQILYGEPAVYGILSQLKQVRRGINEYLDGYLPDDNIKFRNYKIVFNKGIEKTEKQPVLFDWPELEKKFASFHIKITPGELQQGNVLTITGSNGLGKTTFLKMLAGIIKPDKGKLDSKIKIAYKPQDLAPEAGTVKEWLDRVAKHHDNGWFKQNILEKLNLQSIINNNISQLSGGELQKVYIAITLSLKAEVYAFDEPSAFIDVEDRLKVAEVIKDFMTKNDTCAIVVDHDVQFLDYIGDAMLVFKGTPGKEGVVMGPLTKKEGMNEVLKMLGITYRMDKETKRPRINKPGSQLDQEQRKKNQYYYV